MWFTEAILEPSRCHEDQFQIDSRRDTAAIAAVHEVFRRHVAGIFRSVHAPARAADTRVETCHPGGQRSDYRWSPHEPKPFDPQAKYAEARAEHSILDYLFSSMQKTQ